MQKKFCILLSLALASACGKAAISPPAYDYSHKLQIGGRVLMLEIVNTRQTMQTGLSGRSFMKENQGMLFDFGSQKQTPAFWMKDMKFNLDLIWISDDKIIGITSNVPAPINNKNLPTYFPPSPVNQVLEVSAGWVGRNKIQIGDKIKLSN